MDRADKAGLERFPFSPTEDDSVTRDREVFVYGYEQAEKDLALTWEDVKLLKELDISLINENGGYLSISEDAYYKELARRFKESKQNK